MRQRTLHTVAAALLCGCVQPPAPPAPPPPPFVFPHSRVWTARPGVRLEGDGTGGAVPYPAMRLEVLGADSAGLRVRCVLCADSVSGRVSFGEVVHTPLSPEAAAAAGLAEFALAVREAALAHDLARLRPVMAPDFSFSFVGPQTAERALLAWESTRFQALDQVPGLIDRGLATRDSTLWVAPPDFVERLDYQGLRLGFRRTPAGRWEWLFLIRGEVTGGG